MAAKHFTYINTSVKLIDRQSLETVELEVRFPSENRLVGEFLHKTYNTKVTSDTDGRTIWKMNLLTKDKTLLAGILKNLNDFDLQYSQRKESVDDLFGMLL